MIYVYSTKVILSSSKFHFASEFGVCSSLKGWHTFRDIIDCQWHCSAAHKCATLDMVNTVAPSLALRAVTTIMVQVSHHPILVKQLEVVANHPLLPSTAADPGSPRQSYLAHMPRMLQ